jgi:hypothetical protein
MCEGRGHWWLATAEWTVGVPQWHCGCCCRADLALLVRVVIVMLAFYPVFLHTQDKETGAELEVQDKQPLLEWLANNYKKFGCTLEFITNK